jgi:isopenicillin N synthase-like dioxygenase
VVNIGDMLQRLTNHVYPSTTHRVVNPPGDRPAAALLDPVLPASEPGLPDRRAAGCCTSADNPDRYPEPITAHGYLEERLREIKLK